jgi:hypothetical protein
MLRYTTFYRDIMTACKDCLHFADVRPPHIVDMKNSRTALYGQCRRHPPTMHVVPGREPLIPITAWPAVRKDEWCSEFKGNAVTHPSWDEDDLATD